MGDIRTARIIIEDGAYFKGSIDIVKPEPAKTAAAKPAGLRLKRPCRRVRRTPSGSTARQPAHARRRARYQEVAGQGRDVLPESGKASWAGAPAPAPGRPGAGPRFLPRARGAGEATV